jgi:mycothiol synthase
MSGKVEIHPFQGTDEEYRAVAAVWNAAVYPDLPRPEQDFREFDASLKPKQLYQRLVGRFDSRVVALAHYGRDVWIAGAEIYFLDFYVDPRAETEALNEQLFRYLEGALRAHNPATLTSQARENQEMKIRLLEREGFQLALRELRSLLDVAAFDDDAFQWTDKMLADCRLRIIPVDRWLERGPEAMRALWDLDWVILQEVPANGPRTRTPFDVFARRMNIRPDAVFVALDGDNLVGLSTLRPSPDDPAVAHAGLTGVLPPHRRKGLATALKVKAIEFASREGIRWIATFNEENNPMYLLNLKLGFKPLPARLHYEKKLTQPSGMPMT